MAAYSLDLRKRVLRAWDSGLNVYQVAAKYEVSRAWVHRLVQRRRESGSIEPRKQTRFRRRSLSAVQEEHLVALVVARPDATLVELQAALATRAALSTLWRILGRRGFTLTKNGTRRRAAAG